ncbi:MAG: 50S ribosomal protein L35 [Rhizobacter sp.]|nr:50S ribosomal protein L35 [Chlorobiales bacterium]
MPKMKSHRGASKRFRATGSGKIKREKAYGAHINSKMGRKKVRGLHQSALVDSTQSKKIKRMILA